jgi:hypothetical protein
MMRLMFFPNHESSLSQKQSRRICGHTYKTFLGYIFMDYNLLTMIIITKYQRIINEIINGTVQFS